MDSGGAAIQAGAGPSRRQSQPRPIPQEAPKASYPRPLRGEEPKQSRKRAKRSPRMMSHAPARWSDISIAPFCLGRAADLTASGRRSLGPQSSRPVAGDQSSGRSRGVGMPDC